MAYHKAYYTCDKCGKEITKLSNWEIELYRNCTVPVMSPDDFSNIEKRIEEACKKEDNTNLTDNLVVRYRCIPHQSHESFDLCKKCSKQIRELIVNSLNGDKTS